jgi:hypothetical protein
VTTEGRKFLRAPSFERFFDSLEFDDEAMDDEGPPPVFTTPWEEERDRATERMVQGDFYGRR